MNQSNKALSVVMGLSGLALGIGYIVMPSNEEKLKWMEKHSRVYVGENKSFRPEVAQQAKEEAERNQHLKDAIKRAQTSDRLPLGRSKD